MSGEGNGAINGRPPRDGLVRLFVPGGDAETGLAVRAAAADGERPHMVGHFAVFNRWTHIDSWFEGDFMERIAPGAFKKTFQERKSIRALFQHGMDPQVGHKPLGPIRSLDEDATGGAYDVELLDAPYINEILPGLRAGLYGASFKFRVVREDFNEDTKESRDNPNAIPERTVREAQVFEFGPVTFPAYAEATAGVRSLTDDYLLGRAAGADLEMVQMAANGADLGALIARRTERAVSVAVPDVPAVENLSEAADDAPADETAEAAETRDGGEDQGETAETPEVPVEQREQDPPADGEAEQADEAPKAAPRETRTPLVGAGGKGLRRKSVPVYSSRDPEWRL